MTDDRPILVGMNNPYGDNPDHALYPLPEGATGWRVWNLLKLVDPDISMTDYARRFDRRNLCVGPWHTMRARDSAHSIVSTSRDRVVVVLGAQTRDAFLARGGHRRDVGPVGHIEMMGCWVHWIPHPSGLNRWYNDPDNCQRAAQVLARAYQGTLVEMSLP